MKITAFKGESLIRDITEREEKIVKIIEDYNCLIENGYTNKDSGHYIGDFYKSVGNYIYTFNIETLKLSLELRYDSKETNLIFNGDGEYGETIDLDYKLIIEDSDDLKDAEKKLKDKFFTEINKLVSNALTN